MVKLLFKLYPVRLVVGLFFLSKAYVNFLFGHLYAGMCDICWVYRVSNIPLLKCISLPKINKVIWKCMEKEDNPIQMSFFKTCLPRKIRARYSLDGPGNLNIFRDVMILKLPEDNEKGVIVIKYGETYDAFLSYFRVDIILKYYFVVLEISWSGVCDPSYFMFIDPTNHVVVQTPEDADYNFLADLNVNLSPVLLGPADWVDTERLIPVINVVKEYDVVMVANWGAHKNHKKLFKALREINGIKIHIALVGFPWEGRTLHDVKKEAAQDLKNNHFVRITYYESLSFQETQSVVQQSKCSILLSEKEGGSKATTECLFLDVPIIIYDAHIGGSLEKVNDLTGIKSSFDKLSTNIIFMKENYKKFKPRQWAIDNTGSKIATKKLNDTLRLISVESGLFWTEDIVEKVNAPNLQYKNKSDRQRFGEGYSFLLANQRE